MKRQLRKLARRVKSLWVIYKLVSEYKVLRSNNSKQVMVLTMPMPNQGITEQTRIALNGLGLEDVPLIVLREGVTLQNVTEDQMRRLGWHRWDREKKIRQLRTL